MAYSSISATGPGSSPAGVQVGIPVYVTNNGSTTITFNISVVVEGATAYLSPLDVYVNIAPGATAGYNVMFTMPNEDVVVHINTLYYGNDGYYHADAYKAINVSVSGSPFTFAGSLIQTNGQISIYNPNTGVWSTARPNVNRSQVMYVRIPVRNLSSGAVAPVIVPTFIPYSGNPVQMENVWGWSISPNAQETLEITIVIPSNSAYGLGRLDCALWLYREDTEEYSDGPVAQDTYDVCTVVEAVSPTITDPQITNIVKL